MSSEAIIGDEEDSSDEGNLIKSGFKNIKKEKLTKKKNHEIKSRSVNNEEEADDQDDNLLDPNFSRLQKANKWKEVQDKLFWAEIVMFLYAFCDFPVSLLSQKYTLEWITNKNIYDDIKNNRSFYNLTNQSDLNPCSSNTSSPEYMFIQQNQMEASKFAMIRMGVWVLPATFSNLLLGSMSDAYGRRFVFIPPVLASFFCSALLGFVVYFRMSIYFLLVGDIVNGCSGSFGCIILACVAYVVGKTKVQNRLFRLTIIHLSSVVSGTVSPLATGPLLDILKGPLTMIIISSLSGLNLLYIVFFLPNEKFIKKKKRRKSSAFLVSSLTKTHNIKDVYRLAEEEEDGENELENEVKEVYKEDDPLLESSGSQTTNGNNPYNNITTQSNKEKEEDEKENVFKLIFLQLKGTIDLYKRNTKWILVEGEVVNVNCDYPITGNSYYRNTNINNNNNDNMTTSQQLSTLPNYAYRLRFLLFICFIALIPFFDASVNTLFQFNSPLCWDQTTIGLFSGISTLMCALGSIILTPLLEKCLDHLSIGTFACVVCAFSRFYIFFIYDTFTMFIGSPLFVSANMILPSLRTLMTLLVPKNKHGSILGSIASIEIVCCFLGSIIFNIIYSSTLFISTAFVYIVSGGFFLFSAFLFLIYKFKYRKKKVVCFTDSLVPHQ